MRDLLLMLVGGVLFHLIYVIYRYVSLQRRYGNVQKEIARMESELRKKRFYNKELDEKLKSLGL